MVAFRSTLLLTVYTHAFQVSTFVGQPMVQSMVMGKLMVNDDIPHGASHGEMFAHGIFHGTNHGPVDCAMDHSISFTSPTE